MKTTDQPITKRQEDILVLLYLYRFLDRTQIQQLLRHKSKSYIIALLADLRAKDYIQGIYYKNFGDNIKPAIYFVSLGGIRYLRARGDCAPSVIKRLYTDSQASEDFIERCVLRAEIALELAAADPSLGAFEFTTPRRARQLHLPLPHRLPYLTRPGGGQGKEQQPYRLSRRDLARFATVTGHGGPNQAV